MTGTGQVIVEHTVLTRKSGAAKDRLDEKGTGLEALFKAATQATSVTLSTQRGTIGVTVVATFTFTQQTHTNDQLKAMVKNHVSVALKGI